MKDHSSSRRSVTLPPDIVRTRDNGTTLQESESAREMISFAVVGLGVAAAWALSHQLQSRLTSAARDAVFTDLRDGLFVLDPDDRIVELNRTAERIVGGLAAEIIG